MPNTLDVTADDRRFRLNDQMRVQELDETGAVTKETDWESVSGEHENEISFRFENETRTSLAVKYAFNARNQLTVQVIAQHGVADPSNVWTLPGKIYVDDVQDVEYVLVDESGNITANKIEIYAELDFPEGYRQMRVKLPGGSETFIKGNDKTRSLRSSEYHSGGDLARDLLAFNAVTRNTIDGEDEDMPAEISFYGRWDMHENALVFVTKYDNTMSGAPEAFLKIGGQIKATNFGLVVEQGGAALQVGGRYKWNKTTMGWDLKVGYSQAAGLEAHLGAEAEVVGKKGKLTIKGEATLKKSNQSTTLNFDLNLTYAAENKNLVFKISGDGQGYEIQFSGDFKIRNGNVKFEISFKDKDNQPVLKGSVEFGYYTKNSELKLTLQAVLGKKGVTLSLNLEFGFYWGPSGMVAELP
jgi:hypothetical protein